MMQENVFKLDKLILKHNGEKKSSYLKEYIDFQEQIDRYHSIPLYIGIFIILVLTLATNKR